MPVPPAMARFSSAISRRHRLSESGLPADFALFAGCIRSAERLFAALLCTAGAWRAGMRIDPATSILMPAQRSREICA